MTTVKENSKFNSFIFLNFWHEEKRVVTIDILDVYNREISKFSQKAFVIAVMLVKKLIVIKL